MSASSALASPIEKQQTTARAENQTILVEPPSAVNAKLPGRASAALDEREPEALFLVGAVLLGLAAAVRKTI